MVKMMCTDKREKTVRNSMLFCYSETPGYKIHTDALDVKLLCTLIQLLAQLNRYCVSFGSAPTSSN